MEIFFFFSNAHTITFCVVHNKDGGWRLHVEGHSTMFGTALNYIYMWIIGEATDGGQENACERVRKWILDHGGVTYIPFWRKTWLSVCINNYIVNI